ncbi:NADP-dependent oxidoreductase [Herbiconiux sp. CPCC 203407]|uniref:NADP-dependent oxidoreductase n=1 Tax=Herbiconiux oxytropis TaxID=2970915 RepID=A0AA41XFX3_9MICO|nr:NADP-dependent oxidoreductase [Herbiconiux oxytropis]MCS5723553.1 NADP-dependent oxidoreductase [Herbiconiux oxytropis]MCS5727479.1 NADP-dependent oxidoreductase [Herbiconiux oxytropis]
MARQWIARDFGDLDVFEEVEVDVPAPGPGEVTIEVRAAGMNPADFKHVAAGTDRSLLPVAVGYEIAGVISAVGPGTEIASGGGAVGDEVLAFRIKGGYSSARTVPAKDVFAKPANVPFEQAANLLLAGATAAEMLDVTAVKAGDTVLVHGASGSVGVSILQQVRLIGGVRVIGTASEQNADVVRGFGGEPVAYGEGLEARVRELAPEGIAAALDCVGTDEAVDVSLALVPDRDHIVTIAAFGRAKETGIRAIAGAMPASAVFRDAVRQHLIDLAGRGDLVVPIARTYALDDARAALDELAGQHPGGKLALIP